MEKVDSISFNGLTYYCMEDYMKVHNIKSHRTMYQRMAKGEIIKKRFLGKTIYAKVDGNAK